MESSDLQAAHNFMCEVKQNFKVKNRFTTDSRLDALIEMYAKEQTNVWELPAGRTIYRARIYTETDANARFNAPPSGRFKGYNKKESFVNLNYEMVGEGRCNPRYIPYLYASSSAECCVYEVRPAKEAYVSVARIKTSEALRLLRLERCRGFLTDHGDHIVDGVQNVIMFMYLAREFSVPHKNFGDYLLCQYVAEKIKTFGFDGITYESAVYDGESATNYVIFNYEKCRPTSSELRIISDVKIESITSRELNCR